MSKTETEGEEEVLTGEKNLVKSSGHSDIRSFIHPKKRVGVSEENQNSSVNSESEREDHMIRETL